MANGNLKSNQKLNLSKQMQTKCNKIQFRLLSIDDYDCGYFELLQQLTAAPIVTKEQFASTLSQMSPPTYFVLVAVDTTLPKHTVVGTATLLIEQKMIHGCGKVGHLEDVVTAHTHRRQGIAKALIGKIVQLARENQCYKLHLDASENNATFYEKLGFAKKETQFVQYFS